MSNNHNKAVHMLFVEIENDFERSFNVAEGYAKSTLSNTACLCHGLRCDWSFIAVQDSP